MDILIIGIIAIIIYFLPTFIAKSRGHKNTFAIFALNLVLGWTALGWCAALLWAAVFDQER